MAPREDLRTNVLNTLGESGTGFVTSSEVNAWLNRGQEIASERGLTIQEEATALTVADQADYELPSDLLLINSVFVTDDDDDVDEAHAISIADYRKLVAAETTLKNVSAVYAHWQDGIYIYPEPTVSGKTIRVYYLKKSTTMSQDAHTPDFQATFHSALEDYALYRAYLKYKNPQMAQQYQMTWEQSVAHMRRRYGPKVADTPNGGRVYR